LRRRSRYLHQKNHRRKTASAEAATPSITPTEIPAFCPTVREEEGRFVAAAAVAELLELERCDNEDEEVWLDVVLDVRSVTDLDPLVEEPELFEVDEEDVLIIELEIEDGVLEVVCAADDADAALGGLVLVLPPVTPMIVCASPSGTENVPVPLSQSQVPASTAD
jgi:hypothetical protein